MELTRQTISQLQSIRKLAKKECGRVIQYNSPTLEDDLNNIVEIGVSNELEALIIAFMPNLGAKSVQNTSQVVKQDKELKRINSNTRVYRGQIIAS